MACCAISGNVKITEITNLQRMATKNAKIN